MSSDGKRTRSEDREKEEEEEEEVEDDQVTSLRSRVRRRASSRCQIYRRVLDGACPRLLISPCCLYSRLTCARTNAPIAGISHDFVIVRRHDEETCDEL